MSHKKYRKETDCLNCGAAVENKFCSNCGQENIEVRENFFHLTFHFVSDYFHFDSKFFRSLIPLFVKPGFLTKQYWEGKRVNYIHPLRLYFFAIIVAVLCMNFFYSHFDDVKSKMIQSNTTYEPDSIDLVEAQRSGDSLAYLAAKEKQVKAEHGKFFQDTLGGGIDNFMHDLKYVSFFLLPVYALIFKVLYARRKSFYVDHLVFTMHLQAFAGLTMGLLLLVPLLYAPLLGFVTKLTYFLIFAYIAISLWYLYKQSWFKTILKSLIATGLIIVTMVMVMGLYMAASLISNGGLEKLNKKSNVEYPQTEKK
jgi:hypothetical protein